MSLGENKLCVCESQKLTDRKSLNVSSYFRLWNGIDPDQETRVVTPPPSSQVLPSQSVGDSVVLEVPSPLQYRNQIHGIDELQLYYLMLGNLTCVV